MANAPFKMPGFSGFGNESSPNKQQNMMDAAGVALSGALGAVTGRGGVDKTGKTLTDTTGVPPHSHESGGVVPAEGMDAAANVAEEAAPVQEEKKKPGLVKRILGGGLFGRMF